MSSLNEPKTHFSISPNIQQLIAARLRAPLPPSGFPFGFLINSQSLEIKLIFFARRRVALNDSRFINSTLFNCSAL